MILFAGSSILQAAVALAVTSLLARIWRLDTPDQRLPYRLMVLGVPLVLHPALHVLVPLRRAAWFQDRFGLLVMEDWDRLHLLGVPLTSILIPAAVAVGLGLYLRDLVSAIATRLPSTRLGAPMAQDLAQEVTAALADVSRGMRLKPLDLVALDDAEPHLFCAGTRRPRLVVSRGAVERLAPDELRAALAHELAHHEQGDLRTGWLILAVKTLLLFNPVAQVVGRQMLLDFEKRADDRSAEVVGDPVAVASALVQIARGEGQQTGHIESRGHRLLEPQDAPVPLPGLRVALTGASICLLCFFVL